MTGDNSFEHLFYSAQDGLRLHARVYGADRERLPVICLPGLTRNARDFHELALRLSSEGRAPRKVIAFDYRGRGLSEYDRDWKKYDPLVEAGDVVAGLTVLGIEHGAFIGTSRGGLIIFALAAMRPGALRAVVLNDIGPVVEGSGLAQIRSYLVRAPKPASMPEAIAIQRAANGQSFPALTDADWERLVGAAYRQKDGRPVPDFDKALIKTVTTVDLNKPLPTLWAQFAGLSRVPVLAIRGEHSKLLAAETLEDMRKAHPRLDALTVEGQGHAPLLETAGLPDRIATFLAGADGRR